MKKIILAALLGVTCFANMAFADQICGEISQGNGNFYINMGNSSAQLYARNTFISKPLRDLQNAVGTNVCLAGDWENNYLFVVTRVN